MRSADQIARRAVVMGSIAFRASLEVTDHPRTIELSRRIVPWLDGLGIGSELDPIERELLATPYGRLGPGLRTVANAPGSPQGEYILYWSDQVSVTTSFSTALPQPQASVSARGLLNRGLTPLGSPGHI